MRGALHRFICRPRQVWVRRALFQVHLWAGLIAGLYIIVIGLSGSILVFHDELQALSRSAARGEPQADISGVAANIQAARPKSIVHTILAPAPNRDVFRAYLQDSGRLAVLDADPLTGRVLQPDRWQQSLMWVENLHIYLLAGEPGLIANGIGAVCLLLLCLTGIVIWWPGVCLWKGALVVQFRANWKRINFDLHSAMGFWLFGLICFWGVSGIYFAWPGPFVSGLRTILPMTSAEPPKYEIKPSTEGKRADMRAILERARALAPRSRLAGIGLSNGPAEPIVVDMAREEPGDLLKTDYMYFHPGTGQLLATWRYGLNRTAGDWLIWLMHPLHFGTSWGLAVKILWAALGLTLPLLAITGALMYWNRYLGAKLKRSA